jgi:hypothetical protein
MKFQYLYILFLLLLMACNPSKKKAVEQKEEITSLFNGKDLENWRGDTRIWSVEDGCIVGRTTDENQIEQNTFLIYKHPVSDFELTYQFKIVGGNSGVQYRAKVLDEEKFVVGGYQADMEAGINYTGILYEEKGRGILAKRGEQVHIAEDGTKKVESFSTGEAIEAIIKKEQWNSYRVVAKGNHLQHFINNHKTIDVTDEETGKNAASGIIAIQVHTGPNMVVSYKDLQLKKL